MAEIVKIKKDGVIQYPITKPECVIDENGKNVLQLIKENGGGSTPDLSEYLTKEEFNKASEDFATTDALEGYATAQQLTELSAEVSGLSEKIENLPSAEDEILVVEYGKTTFQEVHDAYYAGKYIIFEFANNVFHINRVTASDIYFISVNGTIVYRIGLNSSNKWYQNTFQNEQSTNKVTTLSESSTDTQYPSAKAVYTAIQQSGGGASNKWKCVFDGRMEVGEQYIEASTYADGTPLKAEEIVVQVLIEEATGVNDTEGYISINSTTNNTISLYGTIYFERKTLNEANQLQQLTMKASPMYMVANMYRELRPVAAVGATLQGRLGNKPPQIYEDITYVRIKTNNAIAVKAPLVKIYAR